MVRNAPFDETFGKTLDLGGGISYLCNFTTNKALLANLQTGSPSDLVL